MDDLLETLDLEPIAADKLRGSASQTSETIAGRRNKVAVGQPLFRRVSRPSAGGLLTADDLAHFPLANHEFNLIELAVTLLPDSRCRFRSAEVTIELVADEGRPPLALRLDPQEHLSKRTVKRSAELSAKLGVKGQIVHGLDAGLGGKETSGEEFEAFTAEIESFGTQTSEAGWRISTTQAREVPLNATGLKCLIVRDRGRFVSAGIRVVAEIEIRSIADRWLTYLFRQRGPLTVSLREVIGE